MTGEIFIQGSVLVAFGLLSVSFLLTVLRVLKGPTLPDRILALDMLVAVAIGFIAVSGIWTRADFNVDIAIALGLVGFLATVALARFVLIRADSLEEDIRSTRSAHGIARMIEVAAELCFRNADPCRGIVYADCIDRSSAAAGSLYPHACRFKGRNAWLLCHVACAGGASR